MSSRPSRGAARLAAILDALPDALILVDTNGTVVAANRVALETFERPGAAVVGRGLLDLLPDFDPQLIPGSMRRPRGDSAGSVAPDAAVRADERTKPLRMAARRTDGSDFPAEVTSAGLEDGPNGESPYAPGHHYTGDELLMLVVRDLTGTAEVEAELQRQRRQTEMILRAAAEGIVGTDTTGRVVLVNPSAAQILGYRASELGGADLHPLIHHSRPDGTPLPYEETPISDTLRSGRKHRVRGQVLWGRDGLPVPVDMTTAPVRDGDQLVGAVLAFTDRRRRDALEARLAQLQAVLDVALRSPLDTLRAELDTLVDDPAGQLWPEANQTLRHLSAGYGRMTALIDSVLDFQRLDSGKERLAVEPVNVEDVVHAATEGADELIGPGRAQFVVHAPRLEIEADGRWLALALAHLIAEVAGVDATGQRTAGASDAPVVVAAARRGDVVRIEVQGPRGPGAGAGAGAGAPGAGAGSVHEPLARGVALLHGGILQTHEVPGQNGGAYLLEVPVKAAGPAARAARNRETSGRGRETGNETTVMPGAEALGRGGAPGRGGPVRDGSVGGAAGAGESGELIGLGGPGGAGGADGAGESVGGEGVTAGGGGVAGGGTAGGGRTAGGRRRRAAPAAESGDGAGTPARGTGVGGTGTGRRRRGATPAAGVPAGAGSGAGGESGAGAPAGAGVPMEAGAASGAGAVPGTGVAAEGVPGAELPPGQGADGGTGRGAPGAAGGRGAGGAEAGGPAAVGEPGRTPVRGTPEGAVAPESVGGVAGQAAGGGPAPAGDGSGAGGRRRQAAPGEGPVAYDGGGGVPAPGGGAGAPAGGTGGGAGETGAVETGAAALGHALPGTQGRGRRRRPVGQGPGGGQQGDRTEPGEPSTGARRRPVGRGPAGPEAPGGPGGSEPGPGGPVGPGGPAGQSGAGGHGGPGGPGGVGGPGGTEPGLGGPGRPDAQSGVGGHGGPDGPGGYGAPGGPGGPDGRGGVAGHDGRGGPGGPGGPDGPGGYGNEGAPGRPGGPEGPDDDPTGPSDPAGPGDPMGPGGPGGPAGPGGLGGPGGHAGPRGPGAPGGPVGPSAPGGPGGRAGPAGPAGPGPMAPGGPTAHAGTGAHTGRPGAHAEPGGHPSRTGHAPGGVEPVDPADYEDAAPRGAQAGPAYTPGPGEYDDAPAPGRGPARRRGAQRQPGDHAHPAAPGRGNPDGPAAPGTGPAGHPRQARPTEYADPADPGRSPAPRRGDPGAYPGPGEPDAPANPAAPAARHGEPGGASADRLEPADPAGHRPAAPHQPAALPAAQHAPAPQLPQGTTDPAVRDSPARPQHPTGRRRRPDPATQDPDTGPYPHSAGPDPAPHPGGYDDAPPPYATRDPRRPTGRPVPEPDTGPYPHDGNRGAPTSTAGSTGAADDTGEVRTVRTSQTPHPAHGAPAPGVPAQHDPRTSGDARAQGAEDRTRGGTPAQRDPRAQGAPAPVDPRHEMQTPARGVDPRHATPPPPTANAPNTPAEATPPAPAADPAHARATPADAPATRGGATRFARSAATPAMPALPAQGSGPISVRTLGQGVAYVDRPSGPPSQGGQDNQRSQDSQDSQGGGPPNEGTPAQPPENPAPHTPYDPYDPADEHTTGHRRRLGAGTPPDGTPPHGGQPDAHTPRTADPAPAHRPPPRPGSAARRDAIGRAFAVGAPDASAAEGPEPLDGRHGVVEVAAQDPETTPLRLDDEMPPEPLDNPRRLLVWPEPDTATTQALTARNYRPVVVHSREELDAQISVSPAGLFVDPLTGPITRTALQSLRTAAVAASVPVLVTAGLGQATREAAYGADPAVLLKALAPRDSEQHPPRVLLFEENPDIADALAATLERRGMQVMHAASDEQAVDLATRFRPNLVVMDLMRIRRRRTGIVDWLNANGLLNRTPMVVYTAVDINRAELPRLRSGETVLFLAERSTSAEVQNRIVDLLAKIGTT